MDVFAQLAQVGLVPVVEIPDQARAVPLGESLLGAGLPCAEITFRAGDAAATIRVLREACPDLLVGAGTVLSEQQADAAIEAGAAFVVAPGLNPSVVRHVIDRGVPIIPGVCTPSEIEQALGFGLRVVKFFPAEAAGGVAFLKAVSAPYRDVRFIPTGGIGPTNLAQYLALPQVVACGGSWMVSKELLARGNFASIGRLAREAVGLVRAARSETRPPGARS